MINEIKVNTDLVNQVATHIKSFNTAIHNGFTPVENALNGLNESWDGAASDQASAVFHKIKNNFVEERYKLIENYVNYLSVQADAGYVQAETANTRLADAFK